MGFGLKGNLRWNLFLFSHIAHYILSYSIVESSSDSSGWRLLQLKPRAPNLWEINVRSHSLTTIWCRIHMKGFPCLRVLTQSLLSSCLHFPGRNLCYCWPLAHSAPNLGLILGCHVLTPCRPGRLDRFVSITLGPNPRVHPWVPHDLRSHECK